ncbi:2-dehydro-3-deoxy-6-phosphogalactonate aldolase [Cellulosimicrobium cellulans]|uniref:2-dehydro-3-deoxy-6-phosphogalactonate aldolase n=1 Tax=Cellulosimicrobium cellulans TaxID=1710 RepID=UPI001964FDD7|nr:2-dehydro-3-deoxy-6-phosphogalactonate aldolase [Cellulosimicrobium cellulans]MBN0040817.1 2-dehydro-3-deoxy-6-phosphogalactonate aldolase [Cellulosimicrobium cellulans]
MSAPVDPRRLVAILRGLPPEDAPAVGAALYRAGVRVLEVPLTGPDPLRSITALRSTLPHDAEVGAGTVRSVEDVRRAQGAGASLVVSPHLDTAVVAAALARSMRCLPGVATVTEAFAALAAGARELKVFPADQVGTSGLRAWRTVLPPEVALYPVGGVDATNLARWAAAGADGFGVGGSLYRQGQRASDVAASARDLVRAYGLTRLRDSSP